MDIRPAAPADAPALARLYKQFWEAHPDRDPLYQFKKQPTLKQFAANARKDIAQKGTYTFVAEVGGTVIGYMEALIRQNHPMFRITRYGYLNAAVTDKEHRRQGVARKLTEHCLAFLKKKGISYVQTNVYNSNAVAMKTWRKLGLKPLSTVLYRVQKIK